ncbi:MAG: hypothetical protein L0177_00885, partial [Chloroflexi bacterium]|nr:hypothetical protein [Chloroflexota bacterium]
MKARFFVIAAILAIALLGGSMLRGLPDVRADGAVFVVNSTGFHTDAAPSDGVCETGLFLPDGSAECTLEAAIRQANATPGKDTILFNIPTSDPGYNPTTDSFNILVQQLDIVDNSPSLPTITDPVIIDGYSQPGASPNTLADGNDAIIKIEIDGSLLSDVNVAGLHIVAGDSEVRGLAINGFGQNNIRIEFGGGNVIEGNFIGTDVTGTLDASDTIYG